MALLLAMAVAIPLAAACMQDVRRRLIPDWTVATIGAVGFSAALATGATADAALGGVVGLCAGALAAVCGAWGWGDAKLLGSAGLAAGWSAMPALVLATAATGTLLALVLLALRAPVQARRLALPSSAPRWLRAEQTRLRRAPSVPYGLAIASGLVFALLSGA